jgi:hypothetical protein
MWDSALQAWRVFHNIVGNRAQGLQHNVLMVQQEVDQKLGQVQSQLQSTGMQSSSIAHRMSQMERALSLQTKCDTRDCQMDTQN